MYCNVMGSSLDVLLPVTACNSQLNVLSYLPDGLLRLTLDTTAKHCSTAIYLWWCRKNDAILAPFNVLCNCSQFSVLFYRSLNPDISYRHQLRSLEEDLHLALAPVRTNTVRVAETSPPLRNPIPGCSSHTRICTEPQTRRRLNSTFSAHSSWLN